ncbi:MAG: hypothetical protein M3332_05930 [Actinomycetota bacterium]|nr:hypothetical protein [Actinomycetota bacterium]
MKLLDFDCLPEGAELESLQLSQVVVEDTSGLGRLQVCQPLAITHGELSGIDAALSNVRVDSIMLRQQSIPRDLVVPDTVKILTIDGGAVEDLDFLGSGIRRLHVINCEHLRGVARLRELGELKEVLLSGCGNVNDITGLRNLSGAMIYLDHHLYETNRVSLGPNYDFLIKDTRQEPASDGYYVRQFCQENGREGTISRPGTHQMS